MTSHRETEAIDDALRMVPVVLVLDRAMVPVVAAGAARAGRSPSITTFRGHGGMDALGAGGSDADLVIVAVEPDDRLPDQVEDLARRGARAIPALVATLGIGVVSGCLEVLEALPAGLNVPVPSFEDAGERRRLWDSLLDAGVDERHHLVEVDGHPALDELAAAGTAVEGDFLGLLAAGAAGVLGGRIVAGNRRWAAALGD